MRKLSSLILFSLLTSALNPASAFAGKGGMEGGGGKGVLCRNTDGKTEIHLLDLYEAEQDPSYVPVDEQPTLDQQLAFLGERLGQALATTPERALWGFRETLSRFSFLPSGARLSPVNDAGAVTLPAGCRLVQIARFELRSGHHPGLNSVTVDRQLWDRLSNRDRAAVIAHEFIYQITKLNGHETSESARSLTALLMSKTTIVPITSAPDFADTRECHSINPQGIFRVRTDVRDGINGVALEFSFLDGVPVISQTSAFIPGLTLDFFDTRGSATTWNQRSKLNLVSQQFPTSSLTLVQLTNGLGARYLRLARGSESGPTLHDHLICYKIK